MTSRPRLFLAAALFVSTVVTGYAQEFSSLYSEHQDLSYYLDAQKNKVLIKTPADWQKRREHILAGMQVIMGPLPIPAKPVPLQMRQLDAQQFDTFERRLIAYHTDSPDREVRAYLFIPKSTDKKLPAMLCLHQTTGIGKGEPAGLGGNPNLHYALHLAQRGYVTLAPDYPSFGDYKYDFPKEHGYISGTMKAVYENMRSVDLLQSLDQVDGERIGVIGHSLGGHNSMFTAAFDTRLKVIVSNCGFTRFHKYYGGKLKGWTSARYMPLINDKYDNNPDQVTFDFPEIVASFAPRPFLASSPIGDSNFEVSGVKETIAAATPIYRLLGHEVHLQANYPNCQHDFPPDVREVAYRFIDQHLKRSD